MKKQHIILILLLASYCTLSAQTNNALAEPKPIKRDHSGVPIGTLGFPVGTYLTIEGVKEKSSLKYDQHWLVDTVNGSKLAEPVSIVMQTANGSTNGTRCGFKGFETLQMIGPPPGYVAAAKEAGRRDIVRNLEQEQDGWQLLFYFMDTSGMSTRNFMLHGFALGNRPVAALVQVEASKFEEVTNRSNEIQKIIAARLVGLEKEDSFTNKTLIEKDILKQVDEAFPGKTPIVTDIFLESDIQ